MNVWGVTFGGYLAKILSFKSGNLLYKSNFYLLWEGTVSCLSACPIFQLNMLIAHLKLVLGFPCGKQKTVTKIRKESAVASFLNAIQCKHRGDYRHQTIKENKISANV